MCGSKDDILLSPLLWLSYGSTGYQPETRLSKAGEAHPNAMTRTWLALLAAWRQAHGADLLPDFHFRGGPEVRTPG